MRLDSAGRKFKESDKAQGSPDGQTGSAILDFVRWKSLKSLKLQKIKKWT